MRKVVFNFAFPVDNWNNWNIYTETFCFTFFLLNEINYLNSKIVKNNFGKCHIMAGIFMKATFNDLAAYDHTVYDIPLNELSNS